MPQRVIVTVMRAGEAWGRDLELPADLPAAQLAAEVALALGWAPAGAVAPVAYEIECHPHGRRLLPFETLAQAEVWDGAWLVLHPVQRPAVTDPAPPTPGQVAPERVAAPDFSPSGQVAPERVVAPDFSPSGQTAPEWRARASGQAPLWSSPLVIFLLDVSASMAQPMGNRRRIDVVMEAVDAVFRPGRAPRSDEAAGLPRYRLAMLAYSDQVYDLIGGIRGLDEVVKYGVPTLNPCRTSDMAGAFLRAEALLDAELSGLGSSPAPLICHLTDGEYTGRDPQPVVERIMQRAVPDGHVLVENICIDDRFPGLPPDIHFWPGIQPGGAHDEVTAFLAAISSPIPAHYRSGLRERQYRLASEALMLFPGTAIELAGLGFQGSTPVR